MDFDASVKKMATTTLPVKRLFDSNNSMDFSVKRSKVSLYDDRDKDEDDIPSLNINKRSGKSADISFSSLRKELASLKKSFEECNGQKVEERQLRSIKRDIEKCCKELENKETEVKELESEKGEFEGLVEDFESEKKHFESRQKEFESKEKEFERRVKEFQSEEEEFKGRVKMFETKVEEFEGKMQQIENQTEDNLKSVKALELKENQIEVQIKDLFDEEKEFDISNMDDQFSITIDGTSEEIGILDNLRESSDPAKLVLDIILNPTIPLPKKGDKAVIIDEGWIYLLEQLMIISPNIIKSCVRDEALKLACELKANMKENTENSLEALGFLLILSIYGLVNYFDEDEVFKIFAYVASAAEYKIAVKLCRTLGFANKVSGMLI
ncbi:frigida-LIKE protein [Medicago truncatula]|uniref:FRIGIDA-like protein n=3 Tax=Medicago truncatula TaxID=3880 RepID=G7IUV6_MEDTR|nr:frigida-LIKE protein [Medicago truncatula]